MVCVSGGAPAGQWAVTGRTFSQMPKIMMSTMPLTNSGRMVADSPIRPTTRSMGPPACNADHTPLAMLSGTTNTKATAPSYTE